MKRSNGFSLVELLTCMVASSMVMVLGIQVVQQTFFLSRATRQQAEALQSMSRFAEQFRKDVHNATRMEIDNDKNVFLDQGTRVRIQYSVVAGRVTRVRKELESEDEHEVFCLARNSIAFFRTEADPVRCECLLQTATSLVEQPLRTDMFVSAVLGRRVGMEQVPDDDPGLSPSRGLVDEKDVTQGDSP